MTMNENDIDAGLIEILRGTQRIDMDRREGKGMLYMNRLTFDALKHIFLPTADPLWSSRPMGSLFGVTIICYHGIPFGQWEYVAPYTGDLLARGNVFKNESTVLAEFVTAAVKALEENMEGTDGGYPDGVSSSIGILENLLEQFQKR